MEGNVMTNGVQLFLFLCGNTPSPKTGKRKQLRLSLLYLTVIVFKGQGQGFTLPAQAECSACLLLFLTSCFHFQRQRWFLTSNIPTGASSKVQFRPTKHVYPFYLQSASPYCRYCVRNSRTLLISHGQHVNAFCWGCYQRPYRTVG